MIGAMITYAAEVDQADDWQARLRGFDDLSLTQTWAYGEAKAATGPWRVERGVLRDGDAVVGCVQVLVRRLPGGLPGGLAWIARGPLWRRPGEDGPAARLGGILSALAEHFAARRGFYLRVAPPAVEGALEPVSRDTALRITATRGWASARLDLTRPRDDLRTGLVQKWRNAVNKAERTGVAVSAETVTGSGGALDGFLAAYRAFLSERSIATTVTPELLSALADRSGGDDGLAVLSASRDGSVLGWTLVARYGDTAEYLAGVVGDAGRDAGAGQLLLWRAVEWAQEAGLRRFDLGGLDPLLTPDGIRRFKEGLAGVPYRQMNEVEAVPDGLIAGPLAAMVRGRVERARTAAGGV